MEIKKQKNVLRTGRSFEKIGMLTLKFFILFIVIFMSVNTSAQIISNSESNYDINMSCNANSFLKSGIVPTNIASCNYDDSEFNNSDCIIILPPTVIGQDYCFPITFIDDYESVTLNVDNACTGAQPYYDAASKSIKIDGAGCIPSGNDKSIKLHLEIEAGGETYYRYFWLPVLRSIPVKIVYVLDRSGSMGWTIQGEGSETETRWEILTQSVETFSNTMESFLQDNDAVSLTYFASDLISTTEPINNGFISVSSSTIISNTINTSMSSQIPYGLTAMGSGLLNGKSKLEGNTPIDATKIVLLFTDGEQNQALLVDDNGIDLDDGSVLNDMTSSPENIIKYYTIAMGTAGPNIERLNHIATESNANSYAKNTFDGGALITFFNDYLRSILKGGSPQIVSQKIGKLVNNEYSKTFKINNNCTKILFQLSYNKGDSMYMTIKKGEEVLTEKFSKKESDFYQILSLDLPYKFNDYIYSQGEWTVTVRGNSDEDFILTCITDDHFLNYECKTDNNIYSDGDTINFSVDLNYAGKPLISEKDTVKVVIFKPGDDIGNLLAIYATPDLNQDSIGGDDISGYYQKFQALMNNDSSFYNSLLPNEQIITLKHEGNGHYTGSFDKTELSGIYEIHFLLKGEIPGNGKFIREKIKSAVIEFGSLDNSETTIDIDVTQGKTGQTAIFTIKPKNIFGYYLGPGYLSQIKIDINKKQGLVKDKVDNLDGSYTFTIINIPPGINPKDFKIFVKGEQYIPECAPITFLHFIILIILILILLILLIKKSTNKKLKNTLWLLLILWILYMILQHFNIYCLNLF